MVALGLATLNSLSGRSGMAGRDRDTALGADAVAGAVLTGGSGLGTAAGAVGGAVLGRVISGEDDKKKKP